MASITYPTTKFYLKHSNASCIPRVVLSQHKQEQENHNKPSNQVGRRELVLRCSELAVLGAIFNLSGKKPDYLGVQKNQQALALCPATKNCISTSESVTDLAHYAPPWTYNPEEGRGRKKPVSREKAMEELIQAIESTKPDKFTPQILEKKDDYLRVEYQSPILGFVDDVEFWFPPGKDSIVEYRSASRLGIASGIREEGLGFLGRLLRDFCAEFDNKRNVQDYKKVL